MDFKIPKCKENRTSYISYLITFKTVYMYYKKNLTIWDHADSADT